MPKTIKQIQKQGECIKFAGEGLETIADLLKDWSPKLEIVNNAWYGDNYPDSEPRKRLKIDLVYSAFYLIVSAMKDDNKKLRYGIMIDEDNNNYDVIIHEPGDPSDLKEVAELVRKILISRKAKEEQEQSQRDKIRAIYEEYKDIDSKSPLRTLIYSGPKEGLFQINSTFILNESNTKKLFDFIRTLPDYKSGD